jgi:WD40 repeat protein
VADSDSYYCVRLVNGKAMDAERIFTRDGASFSAFAFSRDESLFAFGGYMSKIARVWNASNTTFKDFPSPEGSPSVAFSPDNELIAIAGFDDRVLVYNYETEKLVHELLGNGHWLTSAKFSVDGRTLAAASPVGEIKFWSMPTGEPSGSLTMEEGLRRIEFGADGNTLFWSSMDGDVGCLQASPVADLEVTK